MDAPSVTSLLDLPEVALHEVLSWSFDSATANALLRTSHALSRMRCDPAAAALLLLRCPPCTQRGGYYCALASFDSCEGGEVAVVQHLVTLLQAGTESGGPHIAPEDLGNDLLKLAAEHGDAPTVSAILSLPPVHAVDSFNSALHLAFQPAPWGTGPHVGAMQVLLDAGAQAHILLGSATQSPDLLPVLEMLLQRTPTDGNSVRHIKGALTAAVRHRNLAAVSLLLTIARPAGWNLAPFVQQAVAADLPAVLELLLSDAERGLRHTLAEALTQAIQRGRAACITVLLDRGADVNGGAEEFGRPLLLALRAGHRRMPMVRLLLQCGAVVTPDARVEVAALAAAAAYAVQAAAAAAEEASQLTVLVQQDPVPEA